MSRMRTLEPVEISAGRYLLRKPAPRDAADVLLLSRDPDVRQWGPMVKITDLETALAWVERWTDWDGGTVGQFGIYEPAEDRFLGHVALQRIDFGNSSGELGYRVAPWARGGGVATAAVRAVSDYAFTTLGLNRLALGHSVANPASCRVAEKAGFAWEGTLREAYRCGDGLLYDEHVHGRLAADPAPQ
jgi:RimJ/RimL family protein N-acetyltransferase